MHGVNFDVLFEDFSLSNSYISFFPELLSTKKVLHVNFKFDVMLRFFFLKKKR